MSYLYYPGTQLGFALSTAAANYSFSLNSATARLAQSFIPRFSGTGWSIAFYVYSVTGTMDRSEVVVELWSEGTDGTPGSLIESRNLGTGTMTSGRHVVSGWTTSLTAITRYFLVFRNANATPASNYYSVTLVERGITSYGADATTGLASFTSSDSGTTWTAYGNARQNLQVIDSTGTTQDFLLTAANQTVTVSTTLVASIEFAIPANTRITAVGILGYNFSSPTGPYNWQIVQGATTIATTITVQRPSTALTFLPFTSDVQLSEGTYECKLVMQSGTMSVRRVDIETTLLATGFPFTYKENGTAVNTRCFSQWFLRVSNIEGVASGGAGYPPPLFNRRLI